MENPALRDVILIFMMRSGLVVISLLLSPRTRPLWIVVKEVSQRVFQLEVSRPQDDWWKFPASYVVCLVLNRLSFSCLSWDWYLVLQCDDIMSDALPSFREFNYTWATEVCINRVSFSKSCLYPTREHQKTKLVFFRLDSNTAARVVRRSVSSTHHYRGNGISTTRSKIQDNRMKIKGRAGK